MRDLPPVERFKQRARLYSGRAARTRPGGGLKHRCVFMHVPKCGGTSVSEALYATVPLHQKIGILDSPSIRRAMAIQALGLDDEISFHDEGLHAAEIADFREKLVLMHMAHDCRLVHGHFLFSEAAWQQFGHAYRYVSILRDPVERTISNYRMDRRSGVFDGDFDAFLDSAEGRRKALHMLRFFGGQSEIADDQIEAVTKLARQNIDRFTLIGFLDDLPGFARDFADIFGARPAIAHYNRASDKGLELTPAQRGRLEALCAPDLVLYEHALRRHASSERVRA